MTEIEKAKGNLFKEVDIDKLIKEACEDIDRHADYLEALAQKGRAAFNEKVTNDDMIFEAEIFMYILNTILNRLPLNGHTLPQFVGAMNAVALFLSGRMEKDQQSLSQGIKLALSRVFIGVSHTRKKEE